MDETEVGSPRPRSRRNSDMVLSEEELGVQAIFEENQQCDEFLTPSTESPARDLAADAAALPITRTLANDAPSVSSSSRPAKRFRNDISSDEHDDEGFTLVQRKASRVTVRKSRGSNVKGTELSNNYFEVCVSSYQLLPKQIGLAMLLKAEGITNAMQIKYRSPYRVIIIFESKEDAMKLIESKSFSESGYRCYLTSEVGITYGVVKYLELDVKEECLMESLQCEHKIVSVKRLNRMSEAGEWISSETVRFGFKSSSLPSYVYGYGCRFKVDPYTFPVTQCASCWKYGHLTRTCPTKKPSCPKCGGAHANCEKTDYRCINCKGKHMALSKSCPVYLKEREIRSIMCQENCTYKNALSKYLENKTRKFDGRVKDTTSIFMFGNKSNVKNYELAKPTMSYSQSVGSKVIQTEAMIHAEKSDILERNDEKELSEDESKDNSEESLLKNRLSCETKNKNRKERRTRKTTTSRNDDGSSVPPVKAAAATGERTQLDKNDKKKINFGDIFRKAKEIVFSNKSFEEKVSQGFRLLFEELMSFIVQMMSNGDVFTKLLGLFYDG